ncbi:dethiobiotin synthase [Holophaga foetida]|uniref:dethiobiotin synthase n=1 Tax=Holophaga foetida TaxID=35839 RepID=UPI0002472F36|nr:dethiobiotin synthase [Holophaga foetida]
MNLLELPSPLWVLGTDTGVGKTHVSARIARAWAQAGPVVYRKPFQTGVVDEEDAEADAPIVRAPGITTETGILLRAPLSPLAAAEMEGKILDLEAMAQWVGRPVPPGTRLLLEPAGGIMVPVGPHHTFLAWATDLGIPAVVVGRGGLGTLNHILLTCEALMARSWTIPAVFLNPGVDDAFEAAQENAALLRRFLPMPVEVLT